MRGAETRTIVVYDIEEDGLRAKVANACKDYGLERIQYSAFSGPLTAAVRRELFSKLADLMGRRVGRVMMIPVCERDVEAIREISNRPPTVEPDGDRVGK